MSNYLFSLEEVAVLLKSQPHQIVHLLATGKVPEPKLIDGQPAFALEDLEWIAQQLGLEKLNQDSGHQNRDGDSHHDDE